MKIAATLTLLFSLPGVRFTPAPIAPAQAPYHDAQKSSHGQWYLADTGHAVYCYGPVVVMPDVQNGLHRVATFCRGEKAMVQLKD